MAPSAITATQEKTHRSKSFTICNLIHDDHEENSNIKSLASKDAVLDVLKSEIANIDVDSCQPGDEDAFYVADLGEVYRQHLRWKMKLGRVKPFYGKFVARARNGCG